LCSFIPVAFLPVTWLKTKVFRDRGVTGKLFVSLGYHSFKGESSMNQKIILAPVFILLIIGIACADTGCPQVPETQGFSTSTAMQALGTVTETDSIVS
jgi:hypothetical protein